MPRTDSECLPWPFEVNSHMLAPSDLVGFPLASPWIEHVKPYRTPRRRLRVAVPCTGVYGSKRAFSNLGSEAIACNIYDIEADYKDVLPTLLGDESDRPHLGPIAGDVMRVPLSSLTSCDFLVAGPPCPPWAGNGAKQSQNDLRCSIFDRILQWICYLSECGGPGGGALRERCWHHSSVEQQGTLDGCLPAQNRHSFAGLVFGSEKIGCDALWSVPKQSANYLGGVAESCFAEHTSVHLRVDAKHRPVLETNIKSTSSQCHAIGSPTPDPM